MPFPHIFAYHNKNQVFGQGGFKHANAKMIDVDFLTRFDGFRQIL